MADGVYSMFADLAPFAELRELLDRHPQLQLYVDDSHGVGWAGKHGRGPALDALGGHPRVIAACSLNKSFARGRRRDRVPRPRAAPARAHRGRADDLLRPGPAAAARRRDRVGQDPPLATSCPRCRRRCASGSSSSPTSRDEFCLPLASRDVTPIRYVPLGLPGVAHDVIQRLLADGHYTNLRHVPGRADEARRRARDAHAASLPGRRARRWWTRWPCTSRRRSSAAARPRGAGTRRSRAPRPR